MFRRGFTLAEAIIGVVLASFVVLIISRLLSSGVRSSVKGAAHLTNVQGASLLISQLDFDLKRASSVDIQGQQMTIEALTDVKNGQKAFEKIVYKAGDQNIGFQRRREQDEPHFFCEGLQVEAASGSPFFAKVTFPGTDRFGVKIRFVVTRPKGTETFLGERFVICANAAENVMFLGKSP